MCLFLIEIPEIIETIAARRDIFSSLTKMPENVETEAPGGLTVDLMLHQKHALSWMLWREGQPSPGGILGQSLLVFVRLTASFQRTTWGWARR